RSRRRWAGIKYVSASTSATGGSTTARRSRTGFNAGRADVGTSLRLPDGPASAAGLTAAQLVEALADGRLEAAVGRLVVAAAFRQVLLIDPRAGVVVAVLVALAVAELLGAL